MILTRNVGMTHHACDSWHMCDRAMVDPGPKERSQGLAVFGMALRCVPYIRPDHWAGDKLAQDLPGDPSHDHEVEC